MSGRSSMGGARGKKKAVTVKSMGDLNVEGGMNKWKPTGNGKPKSDVTDPAFSVAKPVLGKTHLGHATESTMVVPPSAEFLQQNVSPTLRAHMERRCGSLAQPTLTACCPAVQVWHNNTNKAANGEGILTTVDPGARMDFRRRKSDVTRC